MNLESIPDETRVLFESLRTNKLFNKRGHTFYRGDNLMPLLGPDNFYESLARDLASDDESVIQVAFTALKQKLVNVALLAAETGYETETSAQEADNEH